MTNDFSLDPNGRLRIPPALAGTSALLAYQADRRPDRPFLTIGGRTHTYAEVDADVRRLAGGLAALGVVEGTRIALMLPNSLDFVHTWLAAAHLGATVVAINPEFRGPLADNALAASACSVLVRCERSADVLDTVQESTRQRIRTVIDAGTGASAGLDALRRQAREVPAHAVQPWTIHAITFTSGSTGPAKGVLTTTRQALDVACTYIHATGLESRDTLYTPFPFFHGMSSRLGVLPALIVGAHVVVAARFSASRYWQEAAACGATVAQTLPPMTAMLKAQPPGAGDRLHQVTRMYNSRADEEFEERFGVRLVEAYGMTEIGLPVYSAFPERRAGAAGKVHPAWEMALVDEHDELVPPGAAGELVFRPRMPWLLTPGYAGRPEATAEASRNLWFHTGDIGRQDADGYVYFLDRRKERIRRRGENISSFDVESLVSAHPDVRECAALAHPAALGEDDLRVVVVRTQDSRLTPQALYRWLEQAMPKYMLPRYIEFAEALPRTPTNKVEKFKLIAAGLDAGAWDREADTAASAS